MATKATTSENAQVATIAANLESLNQVEVFNTETNPGIVDAKLTGAIHTGEIRKVIPNDADLVVTKGQVIGVYL